MKGLYQAIQFAKDVDITLAEGSNDAYVRAKVTIGGTLAPLVINGAITFYDEDNGPVDFDAAADGVDGSAWVRNDDGTYTATLTRTDRLTQDDNNMPVFDHISLEAPDWK